MTWLKIPQSIERLIAANSIGGVDGDWFHRVHPLRKASADRRANVAAPQKARVDQISRLVFVVLGMSLVEEYSPGHWQRAIEMIKQQRDGRDMGEPTLHERG